MGDDTLLVIKNLNIVFLGPKGEFHALKDISFSMGKEKIGIVGESGSGKTVTGRAILKLLPASAKISADAMSFNGRDILNKSEKEMSLTA